MDTKFTKILKHVCNENIAAALVTIISAKGSTPRSPGAKMLILNDERIFGTIGGGCGEAYIIDEAKTALMTLTPTLRTVDMTDDVAEGEGMVCGGIMEVFIDILLPGKNDSNHILLKYIDAYEKKQSPVLLVSVNENHPTCPLGSKMVITSNGEKFGNLLGDNDEELLQFLEINNNTKNSKIVSFGEHQLFIDQPDTTVNLLILGAGHIALPLSKMAKMIGHHVTVVDDRPQFANRERFQEADEVICNRFEDSLQEIEFTPNTYVVIITRGHRFDKICLREVIQQPTGYTGMIGSRRRVRALKEELVDEGFPLDHLNKVYSPIGLDIGSETPEEIAISILAELIKVHREGKVPSLKLTIDERHEPRKAKELLYTK
ncbi:hypothetical protein BKP35_06410 [Anaerobacillus arseniciselenatis]|uniref:Xanthine dehydrogenase n=1 Tax=Anaerobacillus arseniciselenatis TaxID=85682 RepID=A0A1S2LS71_9BACI|nr:XdhC/CoxI family protein [Anaerobacillus arseniciselenatis]OIJ14507.1 hypothetical protein BKP35_06410 [Anaerobacillus arseniciselenatis]